MNNFYTYHLFTLFTTNPLNFFVVASLLILEFCNHNFCNSHSCDNQNVISKNLFYILVLLE